MGDEVPSSAQAIVDEVAMGHRIPLELEIVDGAGGVVLDGDIVLDIDGQLRHLRLPSALPKSQASQRGGALASIEPGARPLGTLPVCPRRRQSAWCPAYPFCAKIGLPLWVALC